MYALCKNQLNCYLHLNVLMDELAGHFGIVQLATSMTRTSYKEVGIFLSLNYKLLVSPLDFEVEK